MKNNNSKDMSAPYRTHGLNKITAPTKVKDDPRASKIVAKGDLRDGGKRQ